MSRRILAGVLALALFAILPLSASALCVDVGNPLPDVTLPTIDGRDTHLSSFRGKIVLLAFWASWCPRCGEELSFLQEIYKSNSDIVVLAINQESQNISRAHIERIRNTLQEWKVEFPVLIDRKLDAWNGFCINALPTSIIVDPKGTVRFAEPNYYWATQDKIADIIAGIREEKN
jgi:peroxiredoxin